jgi:hypothetical protein
MTKRICAGSSLRKKHADAVWDGAFWRRQCPSGRRCWHGQSSRRAAHGAEHRRPVPRRLRAALAHGPEPAWRGGQAFGLCARALGSCPVRVRRGHIPPTNSAATARADHLVGRPWFIAMVGIGWALERPDLASLTRTGAAALVYMAVGPMAFCYWRGSAPSAHSNYNRVERAAAYSRHCSGVGGVAPRRAAQFSGSLRLRADAWGRGPRIATNCIDLKVVAGGPVGANIRFGAQHQATGTARMGAKRTYSLPVSGCRCGPKRR